MSPAPLFVGIDSGTQSTKSVVIDGKSGKVLGTASHPHAMLPNLPAGAKEQDPAVWITALKKSLKAALTAAKAPARNIKAIAVSGQQHGFVPLDRDFKVIRPAKLWCDTSTAAQAEFLEKKLGGRSQYIAATGNALPAGFTASKILWLKQHEPERYARLAHVLLPHDYLNWWLTGRDVMEHGDASGTGILDVRTRQWSAAVIAQIDRGLVDKLPALQSSEQPVGRVRREVMQEFGLAPDTLVAAGGGDNMMGAIGTGNTKIGIVTASFGTSGTIYAYSPRPVIDPLGEIAAFCDSTGAWLPLLCTMNVTVATELVKRLFSLNNEKLTNLVKQAPTGCDGLILVPYFEGERTPNLPNGTGVYFGVRDKTMTPAHFARAAMEGVTLGMNYGLNRLCELGLRPKEIRITGGGSQNPVWRQIMADVFATPVIAMDESEGAAYGAALQALWCWHLQKGDRVRIANLTDQFVKTDRATLTEPRKDAVKRYRELQHLQDGFKAACAPLFDLHARIRG
jgi:xylulokinase